MITFRITTTNTYSSDFVGWHISAVVSTASLFFMTKKLTSRVRVNLPVLLYGLATQDNGQARSQIGHA